MKLLRRQSSLLSQPRQPMLASLPGEPTANSLRRLSRSISSSSKETARQTVQQQDSAPLVGPNQRPARNPVQNEEPLLQPVARVPTVLKAVANGQPVKEAAPAISVLCRHFTLGQLRSDSPSRVEAYADRLEYFFKHPTHGKVHMVMYFRDFGTVKAKRSSLTFKIMTTLDMFTAHYSPTEQQHMLSIVFDSTKDLQQIYQAVQQGIDAITMS